MQEREKKPLIKPSDEIKSRYREVLHVMLRKADCFNHDNEHCVNRKLGVRPKFNYTVREHVIATLLHNSIRRTLLYVTLTSNSTVHGERNAYLYLSPNTNCGLGGAGIYRGGN